MINLHKYTQENYGLEALQLLQLWEKYVIRDSDYKNHRTFTLCCIIGKVYHTVQGIKQ